MKEKKEKAYIIIYFLFLPNLITWKQALGLFSGLPQSFIHSYKLYILYHHMESPLKTDFPFKETVAGGKSFETFAFGYRHFKQMNYVRLKWGINFIGSNLLVIYFSLFQENFSSSKIEIDNVSEEECYRGTNSNRKTSS